MLAVFYVPCGFYNDVDDNSPMVMSWLRSTKLSTTEVTGRSRATKSPMAPLLAVSTHRIVVWPDVLPS